MSFFGLPIDTTFHFKNFNNHHTVILVLSLHMAKPSHSTHHFFTDVLSIRFSVLGTPDGPFLTGTLHIHFTMQFSTHSNLLTDYHYLNIPDLTTMQHHMTYTCTGEGLTSFTITVVVEHV